MQIFKTKVLNILLNYLLNANYIDTTKIHIRKKNLGHCYNNKIIMVGCICI